MVLDEVNARVARHPNRAVDDLGSGVVVVVDGPADIIIAPDGIRHRTEGGAARRRVLSGAKRRYGAGLWVGLAVVLILLLFASCGGRFCDRLLWLCVANFCDDFASGGIHQEEFHLHRIFHIHQLSLFHYKFRYNQKHFLHNRI